MSNQILTWEQVTAEAQKALDAHMPYRCQVMPSEAHCWHEQLQLWDGLFPPAMVCCWCGQASDNTNDVPHRHGPHVPHK